MKKQYTFPAIGRSIGIAVLLLCQVTARAQAPVNDECAGAIQLSAGTVSGSTNGASESMPTCVIGLEALDTWYKVTTGVNGNLQFTAEPDAGDDIVFEVFSGSCASLTSIACVDNSLYTETHSMAATANTTYYLRIYDWIGFLPNFSLQVSGVVLPVTMSPLSGKLAGDLAQLSWTTLSEQGNKGFDIQRSEDGRTFSSVGWVSTQAESGNSSQALSYQFTDKKAISDAVYYRLQQVDRDGKTSLSNIVRLGGVEERNFSITAAPNPVAGELSVRIKGEPGKNAVIIMTDIMGKVLLQLPVTEATSTIDMSTFAKGVYLLKYSDSHQSQTLKVSRK